MQHWQQWDSWGVEAQQGAGWGETRSVAGGRMLQLVVLLGTHPECWKQRWSKYGVAGGC